MAGISMLAYVSCIRFRIDPQAPSSDSSMEMVAPCLPTATGEKEEEEKQPDA
jgi:hypothetical protein